MDGAADAGAVNVIYGSPAGLTAAINQFWTQNTPGIFGGSEAGDRFGHALAAANFGRGAQADLAIGVPFENFAASNDGGVHVLYGSAENGLTSANNQFWNQNTADVEGTAEENDSFGYSLSAGNFGNSTQADLVIGVPFEDVAGVSNAGAVNVLYGSLDGLTAADDQLWSQDSAGIFGSPQAFDNFGYALHQTF